MSSPLIYPSSSSSIHPSSVQDIPPSDHLLASPLRPSSIIGQTPPLTATDHLRSSSSYQLPSSSRPPPTHQRPTRRRRHDIGDARMISILQHDSSADNTIDDGNLFSELHSSLRAPEVPSSMADPMSVPQEKVRVIWGTNIIIKEALASFKDFLMNFTLAHRQVAASSELEAPLSNLMEMELFYPRLLRQLKDTEMSFLNLDGQNLKSYQPTLALYHQLICHPQEIIPLMDVAVNDYFKELFPDVERVLKDPIQVRPFNIDRLVNMRELSPSDVDQLITIKGLVIRCSPIIPDMRSAFFKCINCEFSANVENIKGKIQEPQKCPHCHANQSMTLIHNRSQYSDKQLIKVQETPDAVPDGQTPHSVTVCVYDTLVDLSRPGDRVEITGIYRVSPIRLNNRQRRIKNIFRTYIDVVHIKRTDSHRLKLTGDLMSMEDLMTRDETDTLVVYEELKNQDLITLSKDPNLYDKLSNSVAPSIWQLDVVKKCLLLQLFGGVSKSLKKFGNTKFRGDINVLLTGDPSVSKSQLLQYVHKLAPRGIYTSGKGSSAVGLTAYITRDPESNQLVLESGALVLSDGGLCCIDEFDKMPDGTRAILHEVMEQQTVSVAKAGIITTLNARTSVLAAANPIESKYNPNKSIVENIHLPPSLLSRFDIICLILDRPDEANDIQLARHITSLHVAPSEALSFKKAHDHVDLATLARYISYAREHVHPVLNDSAIRPLLDGYVNMRKVNAGSGGGSSSTQSGQNKTVSATTRQLESLIRLSEAHAKMRLSSMVEEEDVAEAIRLVKTAILSYALDPVTGKIDMDLVNTGKSASFRERAADLKKIVKTHLANQAQSVLEMGTLLKELNENASIPITEKLLKEAITDLVEEDFLHVNGPLNSKTLLRRLL